MSTTLADLVVKISADIGDLERKMSPAQQAVNKLGDTAKNVGRSLTIGLTLPIAAIGAASVSAAAEMDSLTRGLNAVTGSAAQTQTQLARLQDLARLPGLGFREAIQGSIALQAAGLSASLAERSLRAFGNALATVGKGKADLDGVILALSQIQSKGKISAEEINQLAERVPQVRQAMQAAFGTADTEKLGKSSLTATQFIERLTTELLKANAASGGAANSFENLSDAWFRARVAIGNQLLPVVVPLIEGLSEMLTQVRTLDPETVRWGIAIATTAAALGPLLVLVGSLTTALTGLAAAGVALIPIVAVGGPIAIGLAALSALFVKNQLDAVAAAGALAQYRGELASLSALELGKRKFDIENELTVLRQRQRNVQRIDIFFGLTPRLTGIADQVAQAEGRLKAVREQMVALQHIPAPTPQTRTPLVNIPTGTSAAVDQLAQKVRALADALKEGTQQAKELRVALAARIAVGGLVPNLTAPGPQRVPPLHVPGGGTTDISFGHAAEGVGRSAGEATDKLQRFQSNLQELATSLGALSSRLRNAIVGVASFVQGIGNFRSATAGGDKFGQFTAAASIFGGAVGILQGITGLLSKASHEISINVDALARLRFQATGFDPSAPSNLTSALNAVLALQQLSFIQSITQLDATLARFGLDQEQFAGILEALGLTVRNANGQIDVNLLDDFARGLRDAIAGTKKLGDEANKAANSINVTTGYRLAGAVYGVQDPRPWTPPTTGPAAPPVGGATTSGAPTFTGPIYVDARTKPIREVMAEIGAALTQDARGGGNLEWKHALGIA